jgi:hypothetical protein
VAPKSFDRRIVPEPVLDIIRACQRRAPVRLAGGAALAGVHLRHRLSNDVDLFCSDPSACRDLVRALPAVAAETGANIAIVRDAGSFVRARVTPRGAPAREIELDVVHEPIAEIDALDVEVVEGVRLTSLADMRASKLTCLLSRSEPRDLVDTLFLERAGYRPEADLDLALKKDGGIDPGALSWLLSQFPTDPLPMMLAPLTTDELRAYRDALADRFRRLSVP